MAFKLVCLLLAATAFATFVAATPVNPRLSAQEDIFIEPTEDGAERGGNIREEGEYFEGDMILDESLFRNGKLINGKPARFLSTNISYELDPHFNGFERRAIRDAFYEIKQKSCIRFQPKVEGDRDWVYIQGSESGCFSDVGRVGGRQTVNLGSGCIEHGTIVHELLHALGFFHQQSASDRDDYVTIVWENIKKGQEYNFQKFGESDLTAFGVEYDYDSVMHYGPISFSANGKPTIIPKKADAEIGQRRGLSPKDVKKLNIMYNCPAPKGYSIESLTADMEHLLENNE